MSVDTAVALAALTLVLLWPLHQELTIRALRYALARQREQLHQHHRAIVQLQSTVAGQPTRTHEPMPVVGESKSRPRNLEAAAPKPSCVDADPTLRLKRPPALSDVAGAIDKAGRPLTRATIETELGRDVRSEIRAELLAGTLTMVRTHDSEPAYWPASPGGTLRMGRMPVLPGAA